MKLQFNILLDEVKQQYSSAKTSLNQVSAGHKKIKWTAGTVNLDWGGGKSDMGTEYLKSEHDVTNYVYDPFNRTSAENAKALKSKPDTITNHNVLNVIQEDDIIISMMKEWKKVASAKTIYITVLRRKWKG